MRLIKFLEKRDETLNPDSGNMMKASWYLFECQICFNQIELRGKRALKQKSCKACRGEQNKTHNMSNTRVYKIWQGMKSRCSNPKNKKYHIYGGKGITVCTKWQTFTGFWEDMKNDYSDKLTIDRIDATQGYTQKNCRWITHSKNSSETSRRRAITRFRVVFTPTKHYEEVDVWESAKNAADKLGLIAAHITVVCQGKRKTHGGFHWEYVD